MIKHKYIEHLYALESIRYDKNVSENIRELVEALEVEMTKELLKIMEQTKK